MRRRPNRLGLLLAGLWLLVPAVFAAELRAVAIAPASNALRAIIDLDGSVEYKLFALKGPDRLVLDVRHARLGPAFNSPGEQGVLRSMRTGKLGADGVRVVFDLSSSVQPRSFYEAATADHGHRLILDLAGGSAAPPVPRTLLSVLPPAQRNVIVAIDAGHGGQDPGARGHGGTWEKEITLKIARELAAQIDREPGFDAVLTRDRDEFIVLQDRYKKAREAKADLFISIHADAFHKSTASGSSVFVLSQRGASSQAARWLADQENAADLVGGVSLDDKDNTLAAVLLDLAQSATMQASADIAAQVLGGLERMGKTHKSQVERANFVVLRSPDVPSILVETAFISNPAEEKKLNDAAHRSRLAGAIFAGVRDFFSNQPPPGSWLAANSKPRAREHVVSRGETLSLIASRHGISLATLRSANQLRGDLVRVGDRLRIPAGSG